MGQNYKKNVIVITLEVIFFDSLDKNDRFIDKIVTILLFFWTKSVTL